jgi:hypothetical protein
VFQLRDGGTRTAIQNLLGHRLGGGGRRRPIGMYEVREKQRNPVPFHICSTSTAALACAASVPSSSILDFAALDDSMRQFISPDGGLSPIAAAKHFLRKKTMYVASECPKQCRSPAQPLLLTEDWRHSVRQGRLSAASGDPWLGAAQRVWHRRPNYKLCSQRVFLGGEPYPPKFGECGWGCDAFLRFCATLPYVMATSVWSIPCLLLLLRLFLLP